MKRLDFCVRVFCVDMNCGDFHMLRQMIVKLNNFQHTLQRYELMTYVLNVTEGLFIAINKKVCKSLVLVNFRRLHFRQSKL